MIKNFITIAWRKIKSQRFYAVTNIMGLAIGIACCLLITLLVLDEVSYDNYHERSEDIYRITGEYNFNGQYNKVAVATSLMAEVVKSEVPEIEQTARMRAYGSWLVRKEGSIENIREYSVIYADASIFDIFNFPLISGDKATILNQPNTMVISQSAARRYFGEADPIGETLVLDNDENFVIVGVCEDVPFNTHFQYEFFLSMVELDEMVNDIWLNNNFHTYIRLRPGSDVDEVYTKVNETFKKYAAPQIQQFIGASFDELEASGNYFRYNLQPVRSIHLNSNMTAEHQPNGEKAYVWIFSAIALFVLLIACINFMNLATARSANRAKEVGMRKVLGSSKKTLIVQFLMESVLMSGIAFLLGLSIARIAMPAFNALTGKSLAIPFFNPAFIGVSIFAVLLIGALAGSYPAFFLSAFDPLKVLKGNLKHGAKSGLLRQFLVTSQFTLSIVMMIGTGVIYKQLSYIQNKRLGFEKDQVLTLSASNYPGSFDALIDQIDNFPEVKSSTVTCYLPISNSCRSNNAHWLEGEDMLNETKSIQQW
ncbi:MAG: ABC transporter permease, partial [Bacteroidota bacterium]